MSGTAAEIARLEARVRSLETALGKRSRLLRALTRELCDNDVATYSRLAAGLPPLPRAGIGLAEWRETTALTSADVERTMSDLWRSLAASLPEEE